MEYYNVHWKLGDRTGKVALNGTSKEEVKKYFDRLATNEANSNTVPFEAEVTKIIGPLGRESTPRQKLAQRYGMIMGNLKGAQVQLISVKRDMLANSALPLAKVEKAHALMEMQFTKLKRDISDCFKLSGLRIK